MELAGIFEGKDDMRLQAEALALADAIGRWVIKHNEETPIKNLFYKKPMSSGDWYLKSVQTMGIEGYDDLSFGFIQTGRADAIMATGQDEKRPAYFVCVKVPDVGDKLDVMYSVKWPHLIHELTHYIDRKRSGTKLKKPYANGEEYYNSPMEFNAYFHQGLHDVIAQSRREPVADNFPEFLRLNQISFDSGWRDFMTPETKRRFLRRLYGVWQSLRSVPQTSNTAAS